MRFSIFRILTPVLFALAFFSCENPDDKVFAAFDVYCEMVVNGAKPMALHYPMEPKEVDKLWQKFQERAEKHSVKVFREENFPVTLLFPSEATLGKSVVIIHKGDRLIQYEQFKSDLAAYKGKDAKQLEAFARRFGRLLGYSTQGINELLQKNTPYRNLASFGVRRQLTHLYYENLKEAISFYQNTLGLTPLDSSQFAIGSNASIELHGFDEKHDKDQSKSTAIALLTNQLSEWYDHLQTKGVTVKYPYKKRDGGPHDGFVIVDPGGYLLEFEQFKQHPENELFMAALAQCDPVETEVDSLNFYASITWTYHKDLLGMQKFYEEILGFQLVADQGWTKIYQTSSSGFIGLVDERRGMQNYADDKAVKIEWQLSDWGDFDRYAKKFWQEYAYRNSSFKGPENYIFDIEAIGE
jgi:catechol 2,3-dioxygenase-like lactoylglutathione lyase family enzyme